MGNRDGPTFQIEATVWYHQRIRWQAGIASSKRDHHREGRFQRLDESPCCCQIDYPARHGTEDTSGIYGRRQCEEALGNASISLRVKVEAQYIRDYRRPLEHQAIGLQECRQLRITDPLESQGFQSLRWAIDHWHWCRYGLCKDNPQDEWARAHLLPPSRNPKERRVERLPGAHVGQKRHDDHHARWDF